MSVCPYCGAPAGTARGEIAHMEAAHPEIVDARLRAAGEPPLPAGVTVYGVVAKNGRDELCFFPTSRSEGVPLLGRDGSFLNEPWRIRAALSEAPARRKTHTELERLDP